MEKLGSHVFDGCTALRRIDLGPAVKEIGAYCFFGSEASVYFNENNRMDRLPAQCFAGCLGEEIRLPADLFYIGSDCFSACTAKVIFSGDRLTELSDGAFRDYLGETLSLPSSLTRLGQEAFAGCVRLSSLTLPANVTYMGEKLFYDMTGEIRFAPEAALTALSEKAFSGYKGATLRLPNSLCRLDKNAFEIVKSAGQF